MAKYYHPQEKKIEKAVLLAASTPDLTDKDVINNLDELAMLVDTSGAQVIQSYTQNLEYPNPKTYLGSGKIEEVAEYAKRKKVDLIITDDELSPAQVRNLEKIFNEIKVMDRSGLILHIFAVTAKTAMAKLQIDLAQSKYMLPRLTNLWTHLSKQKGGIGMRGPGEQEIETDRRVLRDKISLLYKRLKVIEKQEITQRKKRESIYRVALVGYTNAGKTSLMNVMSGSKLEAKDKLFATLDTTVRRIERFIESDPIKPAKILLSDTVGFIAKLPHILVESFKSTLAESLEADVLLVVVDVSDENMAKKIGVVKETLVDIDAAKKDIVYVFNKWDKVGTHIMFNKEYTEKDYQKYLTNEYGNVAFTSSVTKKGCNDLLQKMLVKSKNKRY